MNWKQFLKLDKKKITIFLLFLLLFFITNSYMIYFVYAIGIMYFLTNIIFLPFFIGGIFLTLSVAFIFICLYIVSCLMAWIYERFNIKWTFLIIIIIIIVLGILELPLWDHCGEKVSLYNYYISGIFGCGGGIATSTLPEEYCIEKGGTVTNQSCCQSASDFPDTCLIGACGCSPENSHEIKVCDCGEEKCWNRTACISNSNS